MLDIIYSIIEMFGIVLTSPKTLLLIPIIILIFIIINWKKIANLFYEKV